MAAESDALGASSSDLGARMDALQPSRRLMPQLDVVRFGPFAVDRLNGELHKHGTKIRLHGQPLQVLGMLLERPGEVVTREELRARLWGSETFVDFEHGVHAAVNKLRAALNDSADRPRYIETIPRRGYRFIGNIEPAAPAVHAASAPAPAGTSGDESSPTSPSPHRAVLLRYLAAILLVFAFVAAVWSYRATPPSRGATDRLMLAVLPFENLSGEPEQEYFSDGLTEELITSLGQLEAARLGVIARTSVMGYKRTSQPIRQITRELGVDYVLEGSVRHHGARIRVTAQLIRASDETHVWADTYDRTLGDLLPMQTEIARAVAGELQVRLPGVAASPASRQVRWEAHEAALRGRYFLEQRTAEAIRVAREYFERAIALEPDYALGYVGLADAHILAVTYAEAPGEVAMARAREALLRARALDEQNAAVHAWLGVVLAEHDWNWIGAEQAYRRAVELDPNFAYAHKLYSEYLSYVGRFEEAIAEAHLARRLDPPSVVTNTHVGLVLYRARQYEAALDVLQQAMELDPDHPMPYLPRGLALSMLGRHDEAVAALERGLSASDRSSEMLAQLGLAYGRAGRGSHARAMLSELQARARTQHVSPFAFALAHMGAGETDKAIDALAAAYRSREWYLCVLKTEPVFDPLRENPRFQELLRQLNLPS
jgi:TolB-like protein/DNA-binding winged helix-turn-helix (wHTH) protein/Tfp pilus assembly protein PilF